MSLIIWSLAFVVGIGFFLFQIWNRFQVLLKLRKDDGRNYTTSTWVTRVKNTVVYAFGQKKFFRDDQPAGVMHIIIFWGFVTLGGQVTVMFLRGWFPHFYLPLGPLAGPYAFAKEFFEVSVFIAVSIAMYRWVISKPERLMGYLPAEKKLRAHSHWEAILILAFIMGITVSGLFYDAGQIIAFGEPEADWQPISPWLANLLGDPELGRLVSKISWWTHNLIILVFLNLLPRSKHFHIITAALNVFLGKVEAKGELPKRDFTSDNPLFGRSLISQFTWKQALDMYSCTECGRCSSNCPATATGKPLAPRQFL